MATSSGVRLLTHQNGRLIFDMDNALGPEETITKITEDKYGNLWAESFMGNFLINSEGNTLELPETLEEKRGTFFGFNNDIFFTSSDRTYKLDYSKGEFFAHKPIDSLFFKRNKRLREFFPLNDAASIAFYSRDDILSAEMVYYSDEQWKVDSMSLKIIPPMSINIAYSDRDNVIIGGQDGLFIQNLSRKKTFNYEYRTLIRSITIGADSTVYLGSDRFLEQRIESGISTQILTNPISFRHNSMILHFSAPFFEKEGEVVYSSYLEGFNYDWSAWSSEGVRNYTNLTEGTYRFHVKARNFYGIESNESIIEFRILPPWYHTWWAYVIYIILAYATIHTAIALYTRKLQADNRKLEEIVRQRTAEIVEKNHRIEEQNKAITDSIRYAKRIQTAVLPNKQSCPRFEYFIYFSPKDIVSGDFYWVNYLEKDKRLIAVAADCTGHGVPGAFMSMLGTSFLNEVVGKLDVNHSDHILNQLREYVIETLSQGANVDDKHEQKDGMDLGLVSIDLNTMILEFSGANNPMVFIRDNELTEYKPDKMPIGKYIKQDVPFSRIEIELKKDDRFYLLSDGYIDQFGGQHGRKYMKKRFKEFIFSMHTLPMEEQKRILIEEMGKWMEGHEQVDDQIVIGMRYLGSSE